MTEIEATEDESMRAVLDDALRAAAHLLPAQNPIEQFVHHNTLHAFEELSFDEGVREAGRIFGAKAYMSPMFYRDAWNEGRIREVDLGDALRRARDDATLALPGLTIAERDAVRLLMLAPVEGLSLAKLGDWSLRERGAFDDFPADLARGPRERLRAAGPATTVLTDLWRACAAHASPPAPPQRRRLADDVRLHLGRDLDDVVHPRLIRWAGAYLDHGQSYWAMPGREVGIYAWVVQHLQRPAMTLHEGGAQARVEAHRAATRSASDYLCDVLNRLAVPTAEWRPFLIATALALPGFGGMFVRLGERPDLAPEPSPATPLVELLAIRLLLEIALVQTWLDDPVIAKRIDTQAHGQARTQGLGVRDRLRQLPNLPQPRSNAGARTLFHTCLALGISADDLAQASERQRGALFGFVQRWTETAVCGLWHLAYERRYRVEILDALLAHNASAGDNPTAAPPATTPHTQVVVCIDDREESLRRHLEELDPGYETLSYAGYYGIAVAYQGLGEPHPVPLCPATIVPTHHLTEVPIDAHRERWLASSRRRVQHGNALEILSVAASQGLFRGAVTGVLGWAAIFPMALRLLRPQRPAGKRSPAAKPTIQTQLTLEYRAEGHADAAPTPPGFQTGFTVAEMVEICAKVLREMGLIRNFAPLVLILGHGSSSMNNPHEAAHDCGACGGGRGGPNGRAFAQMANRPDVRAALVDRGIQLTDQTWFIGGYHNTANDDLELYDLANVPAALQPRLEKLRQDLDHMRAHDAHERVRRFESASLDLTPAQALDHVIARAEDLAQPRPEYGHATNALCTVGRRRWTRGLFLDRRVFLTSYDPGVDHSDDPHGDILGDLLSSVGPVGAGINLEYYFSFVDPDVYGSNTKLPHNITGHIGVMNGHSSDLQTGLPWQMVEIHEPIRLLTIIEGKPERLAKIVAQRPALARLVQNRWILVVAYDPEQNQAWFLEEDGFEPHVAETDHLPTAATSGEWYSHHRGHRGPARIAPTTSPATSVNVDHGGAAA